MEMKDFSLEGKVALVTGASYGIGFAIAEGMAKAGATIVFNDIRQELVDKGLAAYKEAGVEAHGYVCDVTDEDAVQATVKQIAQEVGVVDILVNNAGIIKRIPMCEMTAAQFRQVVDVDLNAPFIVSKAVIPGMIEKGHGKIINICSMMSELGRETVSAYAAAKGGLKMLTKNIASEYGEYNIQCNGIGPGYIETPQTAPLRERQADGSRHPFDQFIIAKTPAARWGTTEDLVGPAVFLASDASNFVNGHVLYVARRFFLLVLPVVKPGLIASSILTFVGTWNEFLFAAILSVRKAKTLPAIIAGFITDRGLEWGPMAATGVTIIVPVFILVWLLQKDFVQGLTLGSVKG